MPTSGYTYIKDPADKNKKWGGPGSTLPTKREPVTFLKRRREENEDELRGEIVPATNAYGKAIAKPLKLKGDEKKKKKSSKKRLMTEQEASILQDTESQGEVTVENPSNMLIVGGVSAMKHNLSKEYIFSGKKYASTLTKALDKREKQKADKFCK